MAELLRPADQNEPFERTPEQWRRLNAPLDVTDEAEAARLELKFCKAEYHLLQLVESRDMTASQARAIHARRWWRWRRPAFLQSVGALTEVEERLLTRSPLLFTPSNASYLPTLPGLPIPQPSPELAAEREDLLEQRRLARLRHTMIDEEK
jgi:hypothetical protein